MTVKSTPSWVKTFLGGLAIAIITSSSSAVATQHYGLSEAKQIISKETDVKIKELRVELKSETDKKDIERTMTLQRIDSKLDAIQNEIVDLKIAVSKKE